MNGDPLLIKMLLNNLLENAIKYTPKTKLVTVEVFENNEGKHLHVADQGPGIPDAEKHQVFEKFYRMGDEKTRSAKGTGLGLYLCKKIAHDHKGTIHVANNDPEGSVFKVKFR
jgi:K+-sensing histidine kinase KdpD